jgi:hypothetical protein
MAAQAALPTPRIFDPAGVDVLKVHSSPKFSLGTMAEGAYGQKYIYVVSSGALALGALAVVDEAFTARGATSALAAEAGQPGWAQVVFATDQYGWVATAGRKLYGKQKDNTSANAQLFTSNSVGIMGTTGSAGGPHPLLAGVRNVALTSGAGAAYEICAVNPHFISSYAALA